MQSELNLVFDLYIHPIIKAKYCIVIGGYLNAV